MAATPNTNAITTHQAVESAEELAAKAVHKRYEGLVMVRTKAIKGKGAWYWQHFEPILVHNTDTGLPKAVKLRCSLCDAVFSASNPSRTASEHLKRATCPNFNSSVAAKPISAVPVGSLAPSSPTQNHHRKRVASGSARAATSTIGGGGDISGVAVVDRTSTSGRPATSNSGDGIIVENSRFATVSTSGRAASSSIGGCGVSGVATVDNSRFAVSLAAATSVVVAAAAARGTSTSGVGSTSGVLYARQLQQQQHQQHHHHHHHHHVMLSGGKEDLGALAMLEDSVKKLKSPKASIGPTLGKAQIGAATDCLADWVYECCGSGSFSSLEHPKFKAFLDQVGLPGISRREVLGSRLDAKYEEVKAASEAKIRDAMFFQVASDGWKAKFFGNVDIGEENLVNLAVNLPNGTSLYRRAVFASGHVPDKYAEEVLWDTIIDICGNNSVQQCVGIVADKFKATALRNLENQHHWMVNLSCQHQGFICLIKDFGKDLSLFKNVTENCLKLANFVNNKSVVRHSFFKYQLQEYGHAGLLRVPSCDYERSDYGAVFNMVEDILSSARALQLLMLDESYKIVSMEELLAREIEEMMRNPHFWNELEAVHSLAKLIKAMAQEIEAEKPRVGQCLPLWEELKVKVKECCSKFHIAEGPIEKVIERRFKKNYHPAWAAAFILDPLYLIRDASGKYLPPFKCLTPDQEKDVDKLITRLVSREEAPVALMELMKWRTEGLDPVYAQAVQLKQRDPTTGKMKIANPQSSRLVWETYLTEFKSLGKVAVRLIFLHATSCGFKCNWSLLKWVSAQSHSRASKDRAQKLIFIAAHSKLERRDYTSDEDKDAELFALANEIFDRDVVKLARPP